MHKTIVIFCRNFHEDEPPFTSAYYWHAYVDLLLALKERGANAYFAAGNETYMGNGLFTQAYTSAQKVPIRAFRTVANITADFVYDKGGFVRAEDVAVLNPTFVHTITANKAETLKHFAQYQPTSTLCTDLDQLTQAVKALPGTMAVIKRPTGSGGNGVYIGTKEALLSNMPSGYPLLAQEFMDTTIGIGNFVQGIHDLRIKIGGGEIWGGTLRVPAPGEYRANVAQGGKERHLFPDEIPSEARSIALEIDRFFAPHPRYYAIDLANTTQGWRLIELNSKPGLSPVYLSAQAKHITGKLADYLVQLAS
jgi:glutathione synthase/RimK-type ligase-like ATP-grasp enzyme